MTADKIMTGTHYHIPDPLHPHSGVDVKVARSVWCVGGFNLPFKAPFSRKQNIVAITHTVSPNGGMAIVKTFCFFSNEQEIVRSGIIGLAAREIEKRQRNPFDIASVHAPYILPLLREPKHAELKKSQLMTLAA